LKLNLGRQDIIVKKLVFASGLLILIAIALFFGWQVLSKKIRHDFNRSFPEVEIPSVTKVQVSPAEKIRESIFVPYWTLGQERLSVNEFDTIIYFGIIPGDGGIDTKDPGYRMLDAFVRKTDISKRNLLVVRMLDTKQNFAILKDRQQQAELIRRSIDTANAYNFDGIVLDLEVKALPLDALLGQINSFIQTFSKNAKSHNLFFSLALYGDTFYRLRPFDVKTLINYVDEIMVMAYDFHKAGGSDPGPNFPLRGKEVFGYDLQALSDDFLALVPAEKLNIILGMYGYDWKVNSSKKSIAEGVARSYNNLKQYFLDICQYLRCAWRRDALSSEIIIEYTDTEGIEHIIWSDDPESIKRKKAYLRLRGIGAFSYWAYSYY
jgi:hypothetical protein